jgi:hypothetical protein
MRATRATETPAETKAALVAVLAVTVATLAAFELLRPEAKIDSRFAGWFLWCFSALFLVRVVGQLVVRARQPSWLPPMEQWNLTPYRLLLPSQLIILGIMAWVDWSFSAEQGAPVTPHPTFGFAVLAFAAVYAGSMVVRYAVRMRRQPEQRWFGGTIPIVFHWVLASWLLVFGSFNASY